MRTKIICSQLQTLTHTARAPVRANPPHVKISGMQLEICWFLTQLTMAGTFFLQRNYCKFLYQGISFVLQNTVDDNCNFSLLFVRSLHRVKKGLQWGSALAEKLEQSNGSKVKLEKHTNPVELEWVVKEFSYDQSIPSTETEYIKLNTKTHFFFNNIRLCYPF